MTRAGARIQTAREPRTDAAIVRWSVSREALLAAGHAVAATGPDPILEWRVRRDGAEASLVDAGVRTSLVKPGRDTRTELVARGPMVHLLVEHAGRTRLIAVLKAGPSPAVVYARTTAWSELRVPGGRYELAPCDLTLEPTGDAEPHAGEHRWNPSASRPCAISTPPR